MISQKQIASLFAKFSKEFENLADSESTQKSATEYIFDAVKQEERGGLNILSAEYVEATHNQIFSTKAFVCVLRCEMSAKDFSTFTLPVEWAIDTTTKENYGEKFSVVEKCASWNSTLSLCFENTCVSKKHLFVPANIKNLEEMIHDGLIRFQYYNFVVTDSQDGIGFFGIKSRM
jgi:hypothetical protein